MRDKIQSGKFLENANRVSGAKYGDGARKADVLRTRGGRGQNHGWGGIKELGPVMFSDAEHVETHLVGKLNLFQQMLHALDGAEGETRGWVGDGRCEARSEERRVGEGW